MWLAAVLVGCRQHGPPPATGTHPIGTTVHVPPDRQPCDPIQVGPGDWVVSEASELCLSFNAIEGDLTVDDDPSAVSCLCSIGGSIVVDGAGGQLSFPNLTDLAGGLSVVDQPSITSVSMPALASLGGPLSLTGDPALASVDFGA